MITEASGYSQNSQLETFLPKVVADSSNIVLLGDMEHFNGDVIQRIFEEKTILVTIDAAATSSMLQRSLQPWTIVILGNSSFEEYIEPNAVNDVWIFSRRAEKGPSSMPLKQVIGEDQGTLFIIGYFWQTG